MYKGKSVCTIIPCHNEAPRIQKVLKAVLRSKLCDSVVVVDDASDDSSVAKILEFDGKLKLIRNKKNLGKAESVFKAVKQTESDIIFLMDADLENLKERHVDESIVQMVDLDLDMLLLPVDTSPKFLDSLYTLIGTHVVITGQRLIKRKLLPSRASGRGLGYGLEMYINSLAKKHGWKVDVILWDKHIGFPATPMKIKKFGLIKGIKKDVRMMSEMFREFDLLDYIEGFRLVIKKARK